MCTEVIQKELAAIKAGGSSENARASVVRIQEAFRMKMRSESGRRGIRRDLLSVSEALGTRAAIPAPTRRRLANCLVEVLEPLAALEPETNDYGYAAEEEYLISKVTALLTAKLRLVRTYYPLDKSEKPLPLPIRPHYLLSDAADLMIGHGVRAIFQQTMRNKFMATVVYESLGHADADNGEQANDPFATVAKQLMPRFRQNAMEVAVAWRKVGQRCGWKPEATEEGANDMERAAIAAVRAMRIEAEIFDVYLPANVDLNLIASLTQISSSGLEDSLKDIADSINHTDGEPYLRRMLERVLARSAPLEGDLVMLAALHLPGQGERLPVQAANGSCIGSCRSRQDMLSVRSILAGELQRLPGACLDRLNAHADGDYLGGEDLDAILRFALELVIGLSRARFEPELDILEKGLAKIDTTGRIANWLKGERLPSDIEGMRIVLTEAL